jgi:hypothetical protein
VVKPGKLVMVRAAEATAGTAKVSTAGWLEGGEHQFVYSQLATYRAGCNQCQSDKRAGAECRVWLGAARGSQGLRVLARCDEEQDQ